MILPFFFDLLSGERFKGLVNSFATIGKLFNSRINILEITFLVEKIVKLSSARRRAPLHEAYAPPVSHDNRH